MERFQEGKSLWPWLSTIAHHHAIERIQLYAGRTLAGRLASGGPVLSTGEQAIIASLVVASIAFGWLTPLMRIEDSPVANRQITALVPGILGEGIQDFAPGAPGTNLTEHAKSSGSTKAEVRAAREGSPLPEHRHSAVSFAYENPTSGQQEV